MCGAIGAGKTTTLNELAKYVNNVKFIPENVEAFSSLGAYNPLDLLYKNPERYAFGTQLHIISEMEKIYKSFEAANNDVVVTDCMPFAHYWFINALERNNYIDEFQKLLLNQQVHKLELYVQDKFELVGIFYLQNKNFCKQLQHRRRECEMLHKDINEYAEVINACLHEFLMEHARKYSQNITLFKSGSINDNALGLKHFIDKTLHGINSESVLCCESPWKKLRK